MKTKITVLSLLLVLIGLNSALAQVGIGTTDPKTTLQVDGDPATTTTADGIQGPSLTLAQLDARIASYGTDQDGAIVYIDDVTVAYSVGQVVYTTNTGSNGSVAQGVQHAYEIFTVGIKETALNISLSAFPNPTTENLTLQISDYNNEKLTYQLFDMQGKLLINGQITAQQTQINMNSLPVATYFINVVNQENKKVQSFKIIKN